MTIHHWRNAERGLAELGRVLRPGARLAIAEIDLPSPVRRLLHLVGSPHAGWSRRELAEILYRSGFSRLEAWPEGRSGQGSRSSGPTASVRRRSLHGVAVVTAVALLLAAFGSVCPALAVAVFVMVPLDVGFTTMVTVALAPPATLPRLHVTSRFSGLIVQVPWDDVAAPKPAFFGSASLIVTAVAVAGPPFVTVIV